MKINFLGIILLLVFSSCTKKKNLESNREIELIDKNEFSLKLPTKDFLIGSIRLGFHTNTYNSLFAFEDHILMQVIITDSTGNVISRLGGKGRGPKELLHITNAGFNTDNNFIIYDARQFIFKVFTISGNIRNSFKLQSSNFYTVSRNFISFEENLISGIYEIEYLSKLEKLSSSAILATIDYNGNTINTFGNYDSLTPKSSLRKFNPTMMAFDETKNIVYEAQESSYLIQGWNTKTFKREILINKKPPNFNFQNKIFDKSWSRKKIIEESVGYSNNNGVYLADNYIILSYSTRESVIGTDYSHYLAIYNKSGDFIGEKKLDNKLVGVVNNKLYIVKDDNPANYTMNIYEISV